MAPGVLFSIPKVRGTDLHAEAVAKGRQKRRRGVPGEAAITELGWEDWGPRARKRPCFPSPL